MKLKVEDTTDISDMARTKQTTRSQAAASLAKRGQPTPAQRLAMRKKKIVAANKKPKSKAAGDKGMPLPADDQNPHRRRYRPETVALCQI